jgi:chemotaxis protein methyltransferase CheR
MLVRDRGIEPAFKVAITGIDLNAESLAKARRGRYSSWSLRDTPEAERSRWFTTEGRDFKLAEELREAVRFEQHNLIQSDAVLLAPSTYDVIFCRNALMYFTPEHAAAIVEQFARALAPGGYFFMGHAETLRGLSHSFHLRHTHGTFYYQRKDELGARAAAAAVVESIHRAASWEPSPPPSDGNWVGTWMETVERSAVRIRALSGPTAGDIPPATPSPPLSQERPAIATDLRQPLELLRQERFSEALDVLRKLPVAAELDPAVLLLRAALLTHQGELPEAEAACRALLRLDDLSAGAHYLLALCCERRGQASAAVDHDQTAVYLDAGFAMPHLHLGLMARRKREVATARRELGQALLLLEREEPARLLLFGGGFGREALLALCRSELESLKGMA